MRTYDECMTTKHRRNKKLQRRIDRLERALVRIETMHQDWNRLPDRWQRLCANLWTTQAALFYGVNR
jgi:hypothetical protein